MTYTRAQVYELERDSIRAFVASHEFHGRVLDYGCGGQPYRDLVERTATWHGYDSPNFPGSVGHKLGGAPGMLAADPFSRGQWDHVLCTQVIQYVPRPAMLLRDIASVLAIGGAVVLTGPSCWHEEEPESLWRFTKAGIRWLLESAGFTVERLEDRATLNFGGFPMSLGWGAVARA